MKKLDSQMIFEGEDRGFNPLEVFPIVRRKCLITFVVDKSGSMGGGKISSVNEAFKDVVPTLSEMNQSNPDAEMLFNAIIFDSSASKMLPAPVPAEEFKWIDCTAWGGTNLAAAIEILYLSLSRKTDLASEVGQYVPVVILLSDGQPDNGWREALGRIKLNQWFEVSQKVAIAIGEDADKAMLAEFTGDPERVITVHNTEALKTIIKITTKGVSQITSNSSPSGNQTKGDLITDYLKDAVNDTDAADIGLDPISHIEDEWD